MPPNFLARSLGTPAVVRAFASNLARPICEPAPNSASTVPFSLGLMRYLWVRRRSGSRVLQERDFTLSSS
eukprot:397181-Pyramimonas_sp.AAC.1